MPNRKDEGNTYVSNYQILVNGRRKIDGTEYADGDAFPFEPGSRSHEFLMETGYFRIVKAPDDKPAPKPAPRKRSKSS